ncbi:MAG: hypothetical protein M3139_05610 [Bacteroidota bacterium]|nr:hypothetical protein [Bacteroidota bacterium]
MDNQDIAEAKLEKIANTSELETAIKRLERKRMLMEENMKDDFHVILEGLKPSNILKHTLHEVQESVDLKHNLFKVALGLGAGYFSKQLIVGKSAGLVKKALGTALQYGITQFVAKKNDDKNGHSSSSPGKKNIFKRLLSI